MRYYTGSKTIDAVISDHPKVIAASSFRDGDGYWLVLRPGYICAFSDCHTIHEYNVRDTLAAVKNIQDCDCNHCWEHFCNGTDDA